MEMGRELTVAQPPPPPLPPPPPPASLVPGFRFHPTDEELVAYYLRRKVRGMPLQSQVVSEVDIYKSEPWEIADYTSLNSKDLEWYFFTGLDKKYARGRSRIKRTTKCGYWKETGKPREIYHKSETIGSKKTLIYYTGRLQNGNRTNWVMHEYQLADQELQAGVAQGAFVLCRIFEKSYLGPPVGNRYGPFFEEEWEDEVAVVPGGATKGNVANGNESHKGKNIVQMDPQTTPTASKRVRVENGSLHSQPDLETITLFHHKTSKGSDQSSSKAIGSSDSTMTSTQDPITCALIELPLLEKMAAKETHPPTTTPLSFDASVLDETVPQEYLELISCKEKQLRDISAEKESLETELMHAQMMISVLDYRKDHMIKENNEMRRSGEQVE